MASLETRIEDYLLDHGDRDSIIYRDNMEAECWMELEYSDEVQLHTAFGDVRIEFDVYSGGLNQSDPITKTTCIYRYDMN